MYNTNVLQRIYEEARQNGQLIPTGRTGIRAAFAGEVVYAEYALPNGATLWHGKGIPGHISVRPHFEYLAELPEKWLLGEPANLPEPSGELVKPFGNWRPPRGSLSRDRKDTIYYDQQGRAYAYPYVHVYYCYTRKFLSARGCNCEARFDKSIECECDYSYFEDLEVIHWLRRVRGGWELMAEPPQIFYVAD